MRPAPRPASTAALHCPTRAPAPAHFALSLGHDADERFQLPAGFLVRGSSAEFTYVMLHGPTLCSWNVTPWGPVHAECTILAGIAAKLPAVSAVPPV